LDRLYKKIFQLPVFVGIAESDCPNRTCKRQYQERQGHRAFIFLLI
jgi:hypothetical protein